MEIGKVPENVLKRAVFKQIRHRREEVILHPGVGEDCSAVAVGEDEALVFSTDPITGTDKGIGNLAVHITANDLASSGAEPIGIMTTIILPDGTREIKLRRIMEEIETACSKLKIEVMGGHTEISDAVNRPIINVTGVGKVKKGKIVSTGGLKPGDEIVVTIMEHHSNLLPWQMAARVTGAKLVFLDCEMDGSYTKEAMEKAIDCLNPGGRLAVITFHSLEDRMVKRQFAQWCQGCICPPDFPQCVCGRTPEAKLVSRKPIAPSAEELQENSRSRSAKLRVLERSR